MGGGTETVAVVDVQWSGIADTEVSLCWVVGVLQCRLYLSRMSFCVLILSSSGDLGIKIGV